MPTQPTARSSSVSEIVSILLGVTRRPQKALMEPFDLSEGQISRKMKRGPWTVEDIDILARFFGVPLSDFFMEPEVIRRRVLGESPLPWITTPADEAAFFAECEGQLDLLADAA